MTSPSTQPRVRCHHFHPVPAGLWQHGRQVLLQALRKTPKQRAAASQQHVGEELLPWTKGNYGKTHGKRHAEYMGNQGKIKVYIWEVQNASNNSWEHVSMSFLGKSQVELPERGRNMGWFQASLGLTSSKVPTSWIEFPPPNISVPK